MPLNLPTGTRCFIDANIFYYAFTEDVQFSQPCQAFLERVNAGEVSGHTTTQALGDAIHKTMMVEVVTHTGQQRVGLIGWLNKHPEVLGILHKTSEVTRQMLNLRLSVLPTRASLLSRAVALSTQHLLLTNDALILASMEESGLTHLVTNDDDFDRVPDLTVWKPR